MSLVILATGGTGGHVFPAIALAEELLRRGSKAAMVTDTRFINVMQKLDLVKTGRISLHEIASARFSKSPIAILKMLIAITSGTIMAWRLMGELKPSAVVGFGGYPSFPTIVAAFLRGLPIFLHEQNAVMGKSNRILSRFAKKVALSFAPASGVPDGVAVELTGNPVRDEIAAISDMAYPSTDESINILVVGGSLGASVFSKIVPPAITALPEDLRQRLHITQQCREADLQSVKSEYERIGVKANLATFFSDMAPLIAGAHLVICRSGASTVAELMAARRPAIMVPYPHATADHQAANAQTIVDAGGGWMIREEAFSSSALADMLAQLISSQSLQEASLRLKQVPYASAAARLADMINS